MIQHLNITVNEALPPCHYLFVRIDVDVALDALLAHVCPRVAGHPLPLALWALVLAETALLALVRSHTLALGTRLKPQS